MKRRAAFLIGIAVAMYGLPAFAHHSFAMFDMKKAVTLKGTVKEFLWTNPHSWIVMMVPNAQGQQKQWAIELGPTGNLARYGILPKSLKPGMKLSIDIHPLRDGSAGGTAAGLSFTLDDGKVVKISDGAGNFGAAK